MQGGLKTKTGKNRIVPIHHRIMPFIEKYYSNKNKEYLLEINDNLIKDSYLRPLFIAEMNTLGINHSFHECRHTTASLLNKYNAKDIYIKRILGHSSHDLTKDVYTHIELAELKNTIELLP